MSCFGRANAVLDVFFFSTLIICACGLHSIHASSVEAYSFIHMGFSLSTDVRVRLCCKSMKFLCKQYVMMDEHLRFIHVLCPNKMKKGTEIHLKTVYLLIGMQFQLLDLDLFLVEFASYLKHLCLI